MTRTSKRTFLYMKCGMPIVTLSHRELNYQINTKKKKKDKEIETKLP